MSWLAVKWTGLLPTTLQPPNTFWKSSKSGGSSDDTRTQRFPFLAHLPLELRQQIYTHFLLTAHPLVYIDLTKDRARPSGGCHMYVVAVSHVCNLASTASTISSCSSSAAAASSSSSESRGLGFPPLKLNGPPSALPITPSSSPSSIPQTPTDPRSTSISSTPPAQHTRRDTNPTLHSLLLTSHQIHSEITQLLHSRTTFSVADPETLLVLACMGDTSGASPPLPRRYHASSSVPALHQIRHLRLDFMFLNLPRRTLFSVVAAAAGQSSEEVEGRQGQGQGEQRESDGRDGVSEGESGETGESGESADHAMWRRFWGVVRSMQLLSLRVEGQVYGVEDGPGGYAWVDALLLAASRSRSRSRSKVELESGGQRNAAIGEDDDDGEDDDIRVAQPARPSSSSSRSVQNLDVSIWRQRRSKARGVMDGTGRVAEATWMEREWELERRVRSVLGGAGGQGVGGNGVGESHSLFDVMRSAARE